MVRLWTTRCLWLRCLSQTGTRAERIWQSSSVIINCQIVNGTGRQLDWTEWVDDIITERDGPVNLRILKKTRVEVRPLKRAIGFFGSDQIRPDQFGSRPVEMITILCWHPSPRTAHLVMSKISTHLYRSRPKLIWSHKIRKIQPLTSTVEPQVKSLSKS